MDTYLRREQAADGLPLEVDLGNYWVQMGLAVVVMVAREQYIEREAPGLFDMEVLGLEELAKVEKLEELKPELERLEALETLWRSEEREELGELEVEASLAQSSHPKKHCLVQAHWGRWAGGSRSMQESCSIQR